MWLRYILYYEMISIKGNGYTDNFIFIRMINVIKIHLAKYNKLFICDDTFFIVPCNRM